jgi:hypothetical protein
VPELPEVETVRRTLEPAMHGARFRRVILNRPNLRIPFPEQFVERLRGKTVEAIARRGKYLMVALSSGETLMMHLGMSGGFTWPPPATERAKPDAHDHVMLVMSSGQTVVFNDPRRFGFMDLAAEGQLPSIRRFGDGPRAAAAGVQRRGRWRRSAEARRWPSRWRSSISGWWRDSATSTRARRFITRRSRRCARVEHGHPHGEAEGSDGAAGGGHQGGADQCDSTVGVAVSGGPVPCLRTRRAAVPPPRLRRDNPQVTQAARSTFYCPVCQR